MLLELADLDNRDTKNKNGAETSTRYLPARDKKVFALKWQLSIALLHIGNQTR